MRHLENYRLWRLVLMAMLVPLAFIAFWPSPVDQPVRDQLFAMINFLHRHGIPKWFNYQFVEAGANIALFFPLGIVSSLAFQERRWCRIGVFGFLISACIELGQLLFLHNRFSSSLDLVTNTSGAILGTLLATAAHKKLEARRLPAADLQ